MQAIFGHGLRGLPHHHSFAARRTAKGRSGMGPSFQVDREIQRPSIGQNHCHHYTDGGVTTVTLLPTFHHKTQPLTNSQTIYAQHHNFEHRQTTATDTGTAHRTMFQASLPDCTLAPRSITPPQSTTLSPSKHQKHHFADLQRIFQQSHITCQQLHLSQIPTAGNHILQSYYRPAVTAVHIHRQHQTHYKYT